LLPLLDSEARIRGILLGPKTGRRAPIVFVLLLGALFLATSGVLGGEDADNHRRDILRRIASVRSECDDESIPSVQIEKEFLSILARCQNDEEKSLVVSELASVFGTHLYRVNNAKCEVYLRKLVALKTDNIRMQAEAYAGIGSSLCLQNRGAKGAELARIRREATPYHLKAVRLLMDHGIGTERVPVPEGPGFDMPLSNPANPKNEKERAEREANRQREIEEVQEAHARNSLMLVRRSVTETIVYNYQLFPFATEELRQMATDALQDREAVDEIIAQVNEAVGKRLERDREGTVAPIFQEAAADLPPLETEPAKLLPIGEPTVAAQPPLLGPDVAKDEPGKTTLWVLACNAVFLIGSGGGVLWYLRRRNRARS